MWEQALSMLERVPASFWGVVVGALLTLLGIHATNRANDRRLTAQLAHDRDVRNRERDLALRKDIYLDAAEAIQAGLNAIPRFGDLNVPYKDLMGDYTAKSPAIAKVHVVATVATAKAIADLLGAIGAAMLRLTIARAPLIQAKEAIDVGSAQIDQHGKHRDRWLEAMKQQNVEGVADERRWRVLQQNFDFEQQNVTKALEEQGAATKDLRHKNLALMETAIDAFRDVQRLVPPLLIAVRTELDIATDEAAYAAVLDHAMTDAQAHLKVFFESAAKLE